MEDRERLAKILRENSGNIVYGYANETIGGFMKSILLPIADKILEELNYTRQPEPKICAYCGEQPDAAMLVMGNSMAHDRCVVRKLNELLDPDYDGTGEPIQVVRYDTMCHSWTEQREGTPRRMTLSWPGGKEG